jgi:uncharacterized membrane protein YjjP (DUF1212 family)
MAKMIINQHAGITLYSIKLKHQYNTNINKCKQIDRIVFEFDMGYIDFDSALNKLTNLQTKVKKEQG